MIGIKQEDGSFSGTIPAMMKKVGLKLKTIISSVSQDQEALSKLSNKILGCLYDPKDILIGVKFAFNPPRRRRDLRSSLTSLKVKPDKKISSQHL